MRSAEITVVDLCEVISALDEATYYDPDIEKIQAVRLKIQNLLHEAVKDKDK